MLEKYAADILYRTWFDAFDMVIWCYFRVGNRYFKICYPISTLLNHADWKAFIEDEMVRQIADIRWILAEGKTDVAKMD